MKSVSLSQQYQQFTFKPTQQSPQSLHGSDYGDTLSSQHLSESQTTQVTPKDPTQHYNSSQSDAKKMYQDIVRGGMMSEVQQNAQILQNQQNSQNQQNYQSNQAQRGNQSVKTLTQSSRQNQNYYPQVQNQNNENKPNPLVRPSQNIMKSSKQVEILDHLSIPNLSNDFSLQTSSQFTTPTPVKSLFNDQTNYQSDSQIAKKLDQYYQSNPLNIIPESWENESKISGLRESQSMQKIQSQNQSHLIQSSRRQSFDNKQSVQLGSSIKKLQTETGEAEDSYYKTNKSAQQDSARSNKQQAKTCRSFASNNDNNYNSANSQQKQKQKPQQDEKRAKVEAIKARLKQLFLNYCDYSLETGDVFITFTNFIKVLKDAQIFDDQRVNQNSISIILSKECNSNTNMIKNITFEQFLNTILRISEIKYNEIFQRHPKSALKELLKRNILPLLKKIERAVESQSDEFQYSLYTVSELTLKLIIFNEDTQVIFSDIMPLVKMLYSKYFEQEINVSKGKINDLKKLSLKSVMNFAREFEITPYLVHQKAVFLIWYSVTQSQSIQELTNNEDIKHLVSKTNKLGKEFTLGHFIVFIYRLSVIYFNHSQEKPHEFNLIKKLIYFLRKLENQDGFKKFLVRVNRTYTDSLTFLPSKDLLSQILKAEGVEDLVFNSSEELQWVTKEAMLSRILDKHLFVKNFLETNTLSQQNEFENEEELFIRNSEDELKKLFEIYCSFGEPMNTKYLKSSKLYKMFRECGILKGVSRLPQGLKNASQISTQEMDISFKHICAKCSNGKDSFDQFNSQMSNMGAGLDQSQQVSGLLMFQSQMQTSRMKGPSINHQNSANKTSTFDKQSHLIDKNGSNAGRLDFNQYKMLLEIVAVKVYKQAESKTQSYIELLKNIILPQLKYINDKRCVHNENLSNLLMKLDNQEMIRMLTILHKAIVEIYKIYADNKGYLNFQQYINFCSDYDIFPHYATKATLYRIFHSLSFMNEAMSSGNQNTSSMKNNFSQMKSQMTQQSKMMMSQMSRIGSPGRVVQQEYIDEHLFVESLALISLYNSEENEDNLKSPMSSKKAQLASSHKPRGIISDEFDENQAYENDVVTEEDLSESSSVEKVLQLVERMANSEGVFKRIRKGDMSNTIKCNLLDKKDILEPFKIKYAWYFKMKYHQNTIKKKNFDDIMEMSSVYTEGSQLDI